MSAHDENDEARLREAEMRGTIAGALAAGDAAPAAARLGAMISGVDMSSRVLSRDAAETRADLRAERFALPQAFGDRTLPLALRVAMLAAWTRGFLSGLGQAGERLSALDADGREMLRDLETISRGATLASDASDGEDEAAYSELVEYVRLVPTCFFRAFG